MSNFIIIISDEHNPFYSEPYGHHYVRTPNLSRLAKNGVVYDAAYCPSPLCMPSRSSFLSGRRVHEIQVYSNCNIGLNTSLPSIGHFLKKQNVFSVFIGKCDAYAPAAELGFNRVFRAWDRRIPGDTNHKRNPLSIREDAFKRAYGYGIKENANLSDIKHIDEAIAWLNTEAKTLTVPWVLIINLGSPHFPHFTTEEFWNMYSNINDFPLFDENTESAQHPYSVALRKHFQTEQFSKEQILGLRRGYFACISFLDSQIGRIIAAVNSNGFKNNTNIAYTSDHGEMLGKFGMWWKCSMYEDSVRIPLIISGPDFPKRKKIKTPVDLHDLRATIFDLTGTTLPAKWHGTSLRKIPEYDKSRVIFSEYHGHGTPGSSFMIRKNDWKYIWHYNAPPQLFNLKYDPFELNNLAKTNIEILNELDMELRKICSPEIENLRAENFINEQLQSLNTNAYVLD